MNENFEIGCPKCGSTQITAIKKGFSGGKAVAGAILTGGIGLIGGFHGSGKVVITCLACGNKFKPGEGKKVYSENDKLSETQNKSIKLENENNLNRIVCPECKTQNATNHKYCRNCGIELTTECERIHSDILLKLKSCTTCKELTPSDGKYCTKCKAEIVPKKPSNAGCVAFAIIIFIVILFLLIK